MMDCAVTCPKEQPGLQTNNVDVEGVILYLHCDFLTL